MSTVKVLEWPGDVVGSCCTCESVLRGPLPLLQRPPDEICREEQPTTAHSDVCEGRQGESFIGEDGEKGQLTYQGVWGGTERG